MATLWTFESALSSVGSNALAAVPTTNPVKPALHDLIIATATNNSATTVNTAFAIGDTSVGGGLWHPINAVIGSTGKFIAAAWYKVANRADVNNGSGITVTATASGGTGTQTSKIECDVQRPPAGTVPVIDITASNFSVAAATSLQAIGGGSKQHLDSLAWASVSLVSASGGIGGFFNSLFSTLKPMSIALTTNDTLLASLYVGGVQGSAGGGTDTWNMSWTTSRSDSIVISALFGYQESNGNMLSVMGL